jgi:hypothetical protein
MILHVERGREMTEKSEFKKRPLLMVCAQSVALVAALFSLSLCILLLADFVRIQQMDPLNDPQLVQLREKLANAPGDAALIEQVRTYDLYARRAFFSNQEQRRTGGWLLLGGAVACFIALQLSNLWKPKLPRVGKSDTPDHWELNSLFRQLMAGAGILLVALSLFLAFTVQSDLAVILANSQPVGAADFQTPEKEAGESAVSFQPLDGWGSFRGPGNLGVAQFTNAPTSWDVETGEGILWKIPVPVPGANSPIVWNNRVFMSGADEEGQEVFCFDADTGEQLWTKKVETAVELPEVSGDTGFAAPTMTTDGQRVFVIFASGELAAFDLDGNPVWQKNLGVPDNPYGMGSSLITDGIRLFIQYDHQDAQKVIALDCATGNPVWETARHYISWSTPSLIETAFGPQLILNDENFVTAYNPVSGKQLWAVKCLGGEVAPSPAFNGKDVVFVGNEYAQATALKLTDGTPEVLWQYDDILPEIASPVAAENLFFIPSTAGDIVCLDAATGDVKWTKEFSDGFSSSPVLVGDRIYAMDIGGIVHIFGATETYTEIGTIDMGEPVHSTPAFMDGRIYIRGEQNLFCIGKE